MVLIYFLIHILLGVFAGAYLFNECHLGGCPWLVCVIVAVCAFLLWPLGLAVVAVDWLLRKYYW